METKEILENLINKIEASDGKWIKPYKDSFPMNYSSKTSYNGLNVFVLWSEAEEKGYRSNNWLTFKQVKDLGGFVKEGEKSTVIFFFKSLDIKEEGEEDLKTIKVLKTFRVFNVDQTSLELKEEEAKAFKIEDIEEFVKNLGIKIIEGSHACYVPKKDYVALPSINSFISTERYYSTLFHELSHSTGHSKRLNRNQEGKFGSDEYALEELIAETSAVFLRTHFGLKEEETDIQSANYLKGWLKGQDSKKLWKIFSEAQKSFDLLVKK